MIKELERLKEGEVELMLKSPVVLCILIAGADGTIDRKEIKEAINVTVKKRIKPYWIITLKKYLRILKTSSKSCCRVIRTMRPFVTPF